MGYFVEGEFVESEFYEEPIYDTVYRIDEETGIRLEGKPRLLNNDRLNPDIFDAEGNNLGKASDNAEANAEAWAQDEQRKLAREQQKLDQEAKFKVTEGQGIKRAGQISFGNTAQLASLTKDKRSQRATGRFADNRLVL